MRLARGNRGHPAVADAAATAVVVADMADDAKAASEEATRNSAAFRPGKAWPPWRVLPALGDDCVQDAAT